MKNFPYTHSLILLILLSIATRVGAQEYLRVYASEPKVLASNVTGGTLITETFNSFTVPNSNWAPLPAGTLSTLGTYFQTQGQSYIKADDQYGSNAGNYMAIKVGGKVTLKFSNPVNYYGFAWSAGDGDNTIKIIRNNQVIGTFSTADVIAQLPNNPLHTVQAINGNLYPTSQYYGKPITGQNASEPYAYLHFLASAGLAFDAIELSMGAGGEFENDNHSILNGGLPILQGDWVELISILTPTAFDDNGSGMPHNPVTVDVLANDQKGDANLIPGSVQIHGTASAGAPLTVPGEGVWTVNGVTGAITFTPEIGFLGSPTPIQYSVKDLNGFRSNLATVTITYPVGPTAHDDVAATDFNVPVDIAVLGNDVQGSTALNPASITFVPATIPNAATTGVFTVNPLTGVVTFTPAAGFTGIATVDYQVCDMNALCDIATITVNVVNGLLNLYPALGSGTLAFEDLWPAKGDYDFNDMVIDYQFEIITNLSNMLREVKGTFTLKAFGAGFENGFGFQLANGIDPADVTVTGTALTESIISLNASGTESGQTRPTIIIFDNAFKQMQHPGMGIGVNTTPGAPYVAPVTFDIKMVFKPNTYHFADLDIANFNPFIIVNKVRSHEVHLPGYEPTDLMNVSLFGQDDDRSDPGNGKYFVTAENLPWAINIYESFDYPVEKQDILGVHLKFAEWATSGGVLFPDWYKNLPGYRNQLLIYQIPQP